MTLDDIPEMAYRRKGEPAPEVRDRYWRAAFGLQAVDGLRPSAYARGLARRNVAGEMTLDEVGEELGRYYRLAQQGTASEEGCDDVSRRTEEADKVSQRIVALLEGATFALAPAMLQTIHRFLFSGMNDAVYRPGVFKDDVFDRADLLCRPLFDQPDKIRNATLEDAATVRTYLAKAGRA